MSSAPFSLFRVSAQRDPAEQPYKGDAEQNADAVNADILYGRTAVCHHGLVEFIARGKGDTEDSGKERKTKAAQTVDVQRQRNTDREQSVFRHMG